MQIIILKEVVRLLLIAMLCAGAGSYGYGESSGTAQFGAMGLCGSPLSHTPSARASGRQMEHAGSCCVGAAS
jgi:hypothetical protein